MLRFFNFRILCSYQMSLKVIYRNLGNLLLQNLKLRKYYLDRPKIFSKNIEIIGRIEIVTVEFEPQSKRRSRVHHRNWIPFKSKKLSTCCPMETVHQFKRKCRWRSNITNRARIWFWKRSSCHKVWTVPKDTCQSTDSVVSFNSMSSIGMSFS